MGWRLVFSPLLFRWLSLLLPFRRSTRSGSSFGRICRIHRVGNGSNRKPKRVRLREGGCLVVAGKIKRINDSSRPPQPTPAPPPVCSFGAGESCSSFSLSRSFGTAAGKGGKQQILLIRIVAGGGLASSRPGAGEVIPFASPLSLPSPASPPPPSFVLDVLLRGPPLAA